MLKVWSGLIGAKIVIKMILSHAGILITGLELTPVFLLRSVKSSSVVASSNMSYDF